MWVVRLRHVKSAVCKVGVRLWLGNGGLLYVLYACQGVRVMEERVVAFFGLQEGRVLDTEEWYAVSAVCKVGV